MGAEAFSVHEKVNAASIVRIKDKQNLCFILNISPLSLLQKYCLYVIPVKTGIQKTLHFKEDWIPDKDLGNDKLGLLQVPLLI